MPFPIILWEGKEISEFRTLIYLQLHTHRFCIGNLTRFAALSRTISASSTNSFIPCTFHEIFRR